ncbi:MAG TPA: ABC transporter substrate-binding protein [Candidatus Methylomirabilis sp.]|nr:ABC transporter substrate-binding protein [Candidatus Methylomirabilis sp.]
MRRRRMTVLMPFHTPFYAPLPAGVALGHFADEGLDVDAVPAALFGKGTVQALLDGDIEISLSGLMRSFELADRTGRIIVHFAEVCSRNGFFLLGREPRPAFRWQDLVGATVISFAEAPTPWQCMLTVLRRHGVDPARVRIERELPSPAAVAAFRAGRGDFLEQTQPVVEQLVSEGAAHVVVSMGRATGPIPFTSYMTTPEFLAREPDVVLRFTRAFYRTQRWLAAHPPRDVARIVGPAFPQVDPTLLERAVARYLDQDTWAHTPLLGRPGYDDLEQILLAGGFITRRHRYEDLVDTRCARQVMDAPEAR